MKTNNTFWNILNTPSIVKAKLDDDSSIVYFSGKKVSTKAVGSEERHDVTNDYKFAEGSVLEKGAVRSALLLAKNEAVKVTRKGKTDPNTIGIIALN